MPTSSETIAGTDQTGSQPAPSNWTPEQQLAHMLGLCEAQMQSALAESDQAVDTLIGAFTALSETTRELRTIVQALPPELREQLESKLNAPIGAIHDQIASAVVAFQFYDKLTQRLGHVRYSLTSLAMFVCNREQTNEREQWQRLFTTLQQLYRTEEEREIFQHMEDARKRAEQHSFEHSAARMGDIELF